VLDFNYIVYIFAIPARFLNGFARAAMLVASPLDSIIQVPHPLVSKDEGRERELISYFQGSMNIGRYGAR
jgi:hypothetical protein